MLVKAKGNVRDAAGWHYAGDVFRTDDDLGDAVEVLDAPKKAPVKEEAKEPVNAEAPAEKQEEKPAVKRTSRRKTS